MKLIILQAFGGRLRGVEPFVWPDLPPYIYLPVCKTYPGRYWYLGKDAIEESEKIQLMALPDVSKACFSFTGKYDGSIPGHPAIYEFEGFE